MFRYSNDGHDCAPFPRESLHSNLSDDSLREEAASILYRAYKLGEGEELLVDADLQVCDKDGLLSWLSRYLGKNIEEMTVRDVLLIFRRHGIKRNPSLRRNAVDSLPKCANCGGYLSSIRNAEGLYHDDKVCKTCDPDRYHYLKSKEPQRPTRSFRRNPCQHCGSRDIFLDRTWTGQPTSKCGNCGRDPFFSSYHHEEISASRSHVSGPHTNGYTGPYGFAAAIDSAKAVGMRSIINQYSMNPAWMSLDLAPSKLIEALGSHAMRSKDLTWFVKGNQITSNGGDRFHLK